MAPDKTYAYEKITNFLAMIYIDRYMATLFFLFVCLRGSKEQVVILLVCEWVLLSVPVYFATLTISRFHKTIALWLPYF